MTLNYYPQDLSRSHLIAAIERVRALHSEHPDHPRCCAECSSGNLRPWPCPTRQALAGGDRMSPAELLLAAADRIDRARAGTRPEHVGRYRVDPTFWNVLDENECCVIASTSHEADAAWIALLNPQTGEHIAALLQGVAELMDDDSPVHADWLELPVRPALALARAILGGDA